MTDQARDSSQRYDIAYTDIVLALCMAHEVDEERHVGEAVNWNRNVWVE